MASYYAVGIAAFLQIILRISLFIEQSSDLCTTAPTLASWIFLIAFLDVLLDICIYPGRYMHLPYICQFAVETFAAICLTEFGLFVAWCTMEKIICKLSKSLLLFLGMPSSFYYDWEIYILGAATTSTSLAILWLVVLATDHIYFMRTRSSRLCRKISSRLSEAWCKLRSLMVTNKCENNNAVRDLDLLNYVRKDSVDSNTDILNIVKAKNNNRRNRSRIRRSRSRSHNHR